MYVYLFIVCVPENCTCIQHIYYVRNARKYISEDEVMCIILIGSPVPGVQANSFNIQIQPGRHCMQVYIYMYVCIYTSIYIYTYITYVLVMIAIEICNTKNLFEKVTHVLTNIPFTVTKLALFCFKPLDFRRFLEANGLCSEVFQDIHQLFALQNNEPKRRTELPRLFAVVYHGSAGVYQSHGVGTQEADGRNQGASHEFCWGKGVGYKMGGLFAEMFEGNLETSKKSLPTTQNWEVLYITNGSVKIIETKIPESRGSFSNWSSYFFRFRLCV